MTTGTNGTPNPSAQNHELARRAWDAQDDTAKNSLTHTITFGVAALRAPAVINGAGIAALLAFISTNSAKLQGPEVHNLAGASLLCFAVGLIASALAPGGAYFTQFLYTSSLNDHEKQNEHPYILNKPKWYHASLGTTLHVATIALVLVGHVAFIFGLWRFYWDLLPLLKP